MDDLAFWGLTALTVFGFVCCVFWYWALHRPAASGDEEKLAQMIRDTRYAFDPRQKVFYARMDAWQRKYGYCRLYDEAAAPLSMVIDCEPVRFVYDREQWLIEFWKGQYGITTGCEIGIYKADGPEIHIPGVFRGAFYRSADHAEMLPMSLTLRKGRQILFRRSGTHWWLTGFVLGMFSDPEELVMDVSVTLKNPAMCRAFVGSLVQMGYDRRAIRVRGSTARLTLERPKSQQPNSRTRQLSALMQRKNQFLCGQYQNLARESDNMYETLTTLRQNAPMLFDLMLQMGRPAKLFQTYGLLPARAQLTRPGVSDAARRRAGGGEASG